jgi:hypothetical protein
MNRTVSSVGRIFALVGTVLLGMSGWFAWRTQAFIATSAHTEGVVVAMVPSGRRSSRSVAPVVEFATADGRRVQFRSAISSSPPAFAIGERVGVYYPPQAPETARIDTTFQLWFAPLLLAGLGGLFAAIGFGISGVVRRAARLAQELRRSGRPLQAEFERIEIDHTLRVNQRYPWRIHVRWTDATTGRVHTFRSERLWEDPTPSLRDTVTVFVDPTNLSRYHVDVSFLPEKRQD